MFFQLEFSLKFLISLAVCYFSFRFRHFTSQQFQSNCDNVNTCVLAGKLVGGSYLSAFFLNFTSFFCVCVFLSLFSFLIRSSHSFVRMVIGALSNSNIYINLYLYIYNIHSYIFRFIRHKRHAFRTSSLTDNKETKKLKPAPTLKCDSPNIKSLTKRQIINTNQIYNTRPKKTIN